jgi:hypothetical protein
VNGGAGELLAVPYVLGKVATGDEVSETGPPSDLYIDGASPSTEDSGLKLSGVVSAASEAVIEISSVSSPRSERRLRFRDL